MKKKVRKLLKASRAGKEGAFDELLLELVEEGPLTLEALEGLSRSPDDLLRRAAVSLARQLDDPTDFVTLVGAELAHDPSEEVRFRFASLAVSSPETLRQFPSFARAMLLDSESPRVRLVAIEPVAELPEMMDDVLDRLERDEAWKVRQQAAWSAAAYPPEKAVEPLLRRIVEDSDDDVKKACIDTLRRYSELPDSPLTAIEPDLTLAGKALKAIEELLELPPPLVQKWLQRRCAEQIDLSEVRKFGYLLTDPKRLETAPKVHGRDEAVDAVISRLFGETPRAVVVIGPTGSGKTAVIQEVARRLATREENPWHVIEIKPTDFLTGTRYLGEWETRLDSIVKAIRDPKPVVLYVPNVEELVWIGRSSCSESNVAHALSPMIERGEIVILGESTEEAFQRGVGAQPSLRRLFHTYQLQPTAENETRTVLRRLAEEQKIEFEENLLDRALELSPLYRVGASEPGASVDLIRSAAALRKPNERLNENHLLSAIQKSTGMRTEFFDDTVSIRTDEVRHFFDERIVGQNEAVAASVDLVTMIKAGLNDPRRPYGAFLFVGPTGVGKTETARTLADYCFGSPDRMLRLDMSEYATYDSYERLIGKFNQPGLLTGPIKNRPFTLVLLDEIEKAHYNVFDLCLQIFDAGRLTDAQGAVANFRHTMFVMTSNVGAARLAEAPIGFGPEQMVALEGRALDKELRRHFRPEFLNRLDRIVPFRGLSEASVREIARRELDKALLRSGLKRRKMQVEVSAEVEKLLFAEGYSPMYGAREMKRTIEKRALQPLAKALAEGTYPSGASLKLVLDKNDVVVRHDEPAAPAGKPVADKATTAKPAAEKPAREKSSPRKSVASATKKKAKGQTT